MWLRELLQMNWQEKLNLFNSRTETKRNMKVKQNMEVRIVGKNVNSIHSGNNIAITNLEGREEIE